jgi:hypothetical protein
MTIVGKVFPLLVVVVMVMMMSADVTKGDLVLSEQIMKLTKEAAALSILAYEEQEPDDTITHNYQGPYGTGTRMHGGTHIPPPFLSHDRLDTLMFVCFFRSSSHREQPLGITTPNRIRPSPPKQRRAGASWRSVVRP